MVLSTFQGLHNDIAIVEEKQEHTQHGQPNGDVLESRPRYRSPQATRGMYNITIVQGSDTNKFNIN
jgi:hypothetical protein